MITWRRQAVCGCKLPACPPLPAPHPPVHAQKTRARTGNYRQGGGCRELGHVRVAAATVPQGNPCPCAPGHSSPPPPPPQGIGAVLLPQPPASPLRQPSGRPTACMRRPRTPRMAWAPTRFGNPLPCPTQREPSSTSPLPQCPPSPPPPNVPPGTCPARPKSQAIHLPPLGGPSLHESSSTVSL